MIRKGFFSFLAMIIKQVSAEKILPLRRAILRPGYTLEESKFEGDIADSTFHFAGIKKDKIIAACTLIKNNNPNFEFKNQYQLRGMAVAKTEQEKGLGKILFQKSLDFLKKNHFNFIWFNARKNAIDFYLKQNCKISGKEFDIPDVGPHLLMYKKLF